MYNSVQTSHASEVRREALDVALVEELAELDEVGIALLDLAPLDRKLSLIRLLMNIDQLAIPGVDGSMGFPEDILDLVTNGELEVGKDDALASEAQPGEALVA